MCCKHQREKEDSLKEHLTGLSLVLLHPKTLLRFANEFHPTILKHVQAVPNRYSTAEVQ